MEKKLLKRKQELENLGRYLATEVFNKERRELSRINSILKFRYGR